MTELTQQERLVWMGALAQHLATVLTPVLPSERELVATGTDLAIIVRRPRAPLRVASTYPLPTPGESSVLGADAVDEVLRDLQDEIVLHLGEAWPTAENGQMLRARAKQSDHAVAISFETSPGDRDGALVLEPFVPPALGKAHVVG